jgi:hypothetical protein
MKQERSFLFIRAHRHDGGDWRVEFREVVVTRRFLSRARVEDQLLVAHGGETIWNRVPSFSRCDREMSEWLFDQSRRLEYQESNKAVAESHLRMQLEANKSNMLRNELIESELRRTREEAARTAKEVAREVIQEAARQAALQAQRAVQQNEQGGNPWRRSSDQRLP